MRISTKVVLDMETLEVLERHSYEYSGPISKLCGGDALASQKQQEANSQVALNNSLVKAFNTNQSQVDPFAISLLNNGNPYFKNQIDYNNGIIAQQAAPQRAQMLSQLQGYGNTLPSGFAAQTEADFDSNLANQFDQSIANTENQNLQTKIEGAQLLNPLGYAGAGSQAAGSVLSAPPVQSGGFGNFLGGLASGLLNNPSFGIGPGAPGAGVWSI